MRFGHNLTSTVVLLSIAGLAAGDRAAHAGGAQSGHSAPKKGSLGSSYARRSSASGSKQDHVPGKSGIGKPSSRATGGTGLGSSRIATSKHTSSGQAGETARPVVGKAPAKTARPIKTRAEKRAIDARAKAREIEAAAVELESEATGAQQAADQLGMLATRHATALAGARTTLATARQALDDARIEAALLATEALSAADAVDQIKRAAKKNKGSKAVRAFISAVTFGWVAPPRSMSALTSELDSHAEASARDARQAKNRVTSAERAVAAAEEKLSGAEETAQKSRADYFGAEKRARALKSKAAQLRTDATTAAQSAAELEDAADAAALRFDHRIARIDQHRLQLRSGSAAARNRFRREARRFKLATFIESKPAEVSQDALAAAPEEGLFAIADGVTNSDYSGEFARALVRRWTDGAPLGEAEFADWLAGAQAEWDAEVRPLIAGKATAWYNRNKTWQGDAAFVGARLLRQGGRRQLQLIGIGDTVAFLVRGGRIVKSFPLERAAEFSDIVKALPSVGSPLHPPMSATWEVEAGDEVFMGTDALSAWLLGETEAGRDPLPALRAIGNQKHMDRFVADARAGRVDGHDAMGVDDTALLRFVVPAGD
jgi:hypothetical protein